MLGDCVTCWRCAGGRGRGRGGGRKPAGMSSIRAKTAQLMTTNPNAFFFRCARRPPCASLANAGLVLILWGGRPRGDAAALRRSPASACGIGRSHLAPAHALPPARRHVAPHLSQSKGVWTQEERDKFLSTARQWGIGDQWGLFASHIGTVRVLACTCSLIQS